MIGTGNSKACALRNPQLGALTEPPLLFLDDNPKEFDQKLRRESGIYCVVFDNESHSRDVTVTS